MYERYAWGLGCGWTGYGVLYWLYANPLVYMFILLSLHTQSLMSKRLCFDSHVSCIVSAITRPRFLFSYVCHSESDTQRLLGIQIRNVGPCTWFWLLRDRCHRYPVLVQLYTTWTVQNLRRFMVAQFLTSLTLPLKNFATKKVTKWILIMILLQITTSSE